MKRLTMVLLAVVLTTAGFSAAPAYSVGVGEPVITAPLADSTHQQEDEIGFAVDFSNAPADNYDLAIVDSSAPSDAAPAYDTSFDSGLQGESASFSISLVPGTYTFTVSDSLETARASETFIVKKTIKKPSKPRSFHSARGNHKVRVGWTAPSSNGGAKISGYQVKRYGAVRNVSAGTRAKTFTGLKNGHKYNFYVRAKNTAGWSKWTHTTGTPKAPKPKPKPKHSHPVKEYQNCTAMHHDYPHGVGKPGAHDHGGSVTNFYRSTTVYNLNTKSDRDKDGIACEKA